MRASKKAKNVAKSALIVGASRGIGFGLAKELRGRGWDVVATVREGTSPAELLAVGCSSVQVADINNRVQVEALAKGLQGHPLDLVVVNAGVMQPRTKTVDEWSDEDVSKIMLTNAISPIRVARALLPLVKDDGIVMLMTSIMGSVASNDSGAIGLYRASKAALNSLTRTFAAEDVGNKAVGVIAMHPGWVKTDMGGAGAAVEVAESVGGIADEAEKRAGMRGVVFIDYAGNTIPW
jgi:NAD(P)-dependent dehydrogenase (short-subunit alcohol dehydrogenase family)